MEYNIEGFEEMTAEEKLAALETYLKGYDPEKNGYVKKDVLDSAASDASKYKKDLKTAQQSQKTLEERIAQLEREKKVSETTAEFISLGYDAELAKSSAEAMINGETAKLLENQKSFLEGYKAKVTVDGLNKTPRPAAGGVSDVATDYSKLKADALLRGDTAAYAYYIRAEQQEQRNN